MWQKDLLMLLKINQYRELSVAVPLRYLLRSWVYHRKKGFIFFVCFELSQTALCEVFCAILFLHNCVIIIFSISNSCFKTHFFLTDCWTLNLPWKGVIVVIFRESSPSHYWCWVILWDLALPQNVFVLFQALLGAEELLSACQNLSVFIIII